MKKIHLFVLVPVVIILATSSCSLFGPNPKKISQWIPELTTTSTVSYRWSGSYQQAGKDYFGEDSPTPEAENYSIIEATYGDVQSKVLFREEGGDRFFIIADENRGMIFISNDEYADPLEDAVMLKTPVEEGTSWVSDFYGAEASFSISGVKQDWANGGVSVDDAVTVNISIIDVDYDHWSGVVIKGYYSPTAGYLGFTEDFPTNSDDSAYTWYYDTRSFKMTNFVP